ncbi:translational GTPase TypA [Patescibacteria group bacterium]|nr:translational GTPase TypA [Patescibacteria group bacterium]MBU1868002.1 translational GTPase TypA [Patescibacteria group bacterium]
MKMSDVKKIRNVAVIAHVDHGKTTLIDALLKQTHTFRENQEEMGADRILDSNDQERERGITITAKNCAINFEGTKINIIDTPGHVDFSGEVERTLSMANGALLIIDAQEGPMPQTRFVLRKALELGLKIIVVINKIDKQYARIPYVIKKTENLFLDLAKTEEQLNFPILYSFGRGGKVFEYLPDNFNVDADVNPLLRKIINFIPPPESNDNKKFKMLVSSFEHNSHLGKILIGRIHQGVIEKGQKVSLIQKSNSSYTVEKVFVSEGLSRKEVEQASSGDIVAIAGLGDVKIGDTIADPSETGALLSMQISEPTLHIVVGPNTSPLSGSEGEFLTSRQIEKRLNREVEKNLSLRVEKRDDSKFVVSGRGELHLTVFLEELRRDGFEIEVEKPEVIIREIEGVKNEPVEELDIIVPKEHVGVINQELGKRYAALVNTEPISDREVEFIYHMPTRALIGLRSLLATQTKGTVIFNSHVIDYRPVGKPVRRLRAGVLVASQDGDTVAYGLNAAQERGVTFVGPGVKVYEGMIVGKNTKNDDIAINVCKGKKLTNMRAKGSDEIIQLTPPTEMTLEKSLEFIESDELMEITPKSVRLRKKILNKAERRRFQKNTQSV